jgi:eukaryotic-like serine/threonine-protein kinase
MSQGDDIVGRTLLGRYRVVLPLAQGGMGMVYLARTEGAAGFAKPVVVKRMLPELVANRTTVDLFVREAKILANLQHPGVVNVLDFGQEDAAYVMVLEYVHGYDLGAWTTYAKTIGSPIPCEFVLFALLRVLEALSHAHQCRRPDGKPLEIVHRDVSPGNILLSLDGQVKLGDFGIARISDEVSGFGTQFGTFRGKFSYAAPELLEGHEATPAADIYSAGVVLLELVLGTNPYAAATVVESMHRTLVVSPPKLEGFRPDVPAGLDAVIARALAKTIEERYATAAEFADAIRKLLTRPEDQIAPALVQRINADFTGDMARALELESLEDRDRAWRSAQPAEQAARLGSTAPPAPDVAGQPAAKKADVDTLAEARAPAAARGRRPRGRGTPFWAIAGGLVMLGSSAGAAWLVVRSRTSAGPDYVVIERQPTDNGPSSQQPSAPPGSASTPKVPDSAAAPPVVPSPGSSVQRAAPDEEATQTANLSAALQRQQGRIQSCFEKNVADLEGSPRVTVRFELDATGQVQGASLEPASVAAHPLGACLLGVARATRFPAPGRTVSFRVPITARVTARGAPSGPDRARDTGP